MGLAADIITYFDANWASGTGGTEPAKWLLYHQSMEHQTGNDCLVEELPGLPDEDSVGGGHYTTTQRCRLEYKVTDRTDADKKVTETRRLAAAKTVTGGYWTVDEFDVRDYNGHSIAEVYVQQVTES